MNHTPPTVETVRAALDCIPPDALTHDERARLAFAVFDAVGDAGGDLWLSWAATRTDPKPAKDRATWKSARKPGPVKAGTLFHMAKDYGFTFEGVQTPAHKPTPAELKALADARRQAEEREARSRAARERRAAAKAARLWAAAALEGHSPYLARKGVQAHGLRFAPGGAVLVPRYDSAGELWSLETILPERPSEDESDKLNLKDGRTPGTFHLIGQAEGAAWLLVAEGYATAASCFEATGRPCVVAFTAGNLAHVVRALRGRFPAARLLVCGDDDADTQARTGRNPGREKAVEAARLAGGVAVFPEGLPPGGSDFNDLHRAAGLEAVRVLIERAIAGAGPVQRQGRGAADAGAAQPEGTARPDKRTKRAAAGASGTGDDLTTSSFRVDEEGVWFDERPDESGGPIRPVKVCGPLHVSALARDAQDGGAALLLEFDTPFRAGRRWLMPLAMLAGDGTAYRAELLNQGFMVPIDTRRRALLTAYLQSRKPAELVRIVDRVGWHGRAYVLPGETLGDSGEERFMFQGEAAAEGAFAQRGTLAQWQEQIGRLCVGNSRLILAACCAFAAPLLRWTGQTEGKGVHLRGDSRLGKTTASRVAVSIMGPPAYKQSWRATANGLEGMAVACSDAVLVLDEFGLVDPNEAGDAAYLLASGQSKGRSQANGGNRRRLSWLLIFLSNGEVSLAEHMESAGKRVRAGQELRMIDVPADPGLGYGIFETVHEFEAGEAAATHIERAGAKCYGTAGRAWLESLVSDTEGLAKTLREQIQRVQAAMVPESASGQVWDAGRFFALLAVAGEMATARGITGWPEGEARQGVRRCFEAWLATRPAGLGRTEDVQILRQVREHFGTYGEMNYKRWGMVDGNHAPAVPMMAGWRRPVYADELNSAGQMVQVEVGRTWYVLADKFRSVVCKGLPVARCLEVLASRGLLICEPNGRKLHRAKPPGETKTGADVYRISSAILATPDTD